MSEFDIKKYISRDFLLVLGVGLFALASVSGWLTAEKIDAVADKIESTTESVPRIIDALKKLFDVNGPLVVFALAVWAWIKRNNSLKEAKLNADKEIKLLEMKKDILKMQQGVAKTGKVEVKI